MKESRSAKTNTWRIVSKATRTAEFVLSCLLMIKIILTNKIELVSDPYFQNKLLLRFQGNIYIALSIPFLKKIDVLFAAQSRLSVTMFVLDSVDSVRLNVNPKQARQRQITYIIRKIMS